MLHRSVDGTPTHDIDKSDPNTPRLPPTTIGNGDLENIPKEEAMHLDNSDKALTNPSTSSSKHQSLSSQASFSSFFRTIPEPIVSNSNPPVYAQEVRHPVELQDEASTFSRLHTPQQDFGPPKSAPPRYTPRTTSDDSQRSPRMSGTSDQDNGSSLNGREHSAREEAFSEKRHRSSSRSSQNRVEKRIEATLADAEPSSHASSRKSSHTLGLFKETTTTTSQTIKRGQERSRTASANAADATAITNTRSVKPRAHARSVFEDTRGQDGEVGSLEETRSLHRDKDYQDDEIERSSRDHQQALIPISQSGVDLPSIARNDSVTLTEDSNKKGVTKPSKETDTAKHNVPTRLLEEIRNYHNLAAPFHDKFRTTQSKSRGSTQKNIHVENLPRPNAVGENLEDQTLIKETEAKEEPEIEEDESEQISSALYYPHQAPSPDALEDVSIDDARKSKEASTALEVPLPEPALSSEKESERSADVDLALQVHNKNRYFHGDLSKAQVLPTEYEDKQASESDASSASESDYESQDESKRHGLPEDSSNTDDGEATPRASPNTRKSWMLNRPRKTHRGPAAPLGAVELKPYNHQVGGHTNLFRFSKRAVCKQLSNRENEFYEVVERQHPELLKFLPK